MAFISLEVTAVFARIFIVCTIIVLSIASLRLYLSIKGEWVRAVKPYIDISKYIFIFATILCFDQAIELLELVNNLGFVILPLGTGEIDIIRAFLDLLLIVGLVPLIITLFRSYYLLVYRQS